MWPKLWSTAGVFIPSLNGQLFTHILPLDPLIQPQPGGGFSSVKASHQTMYGKVSSAWKLKDGSFELGVEIPANTRATVRLPKAQLASVMEAGQALCSGNGITGVRQEGDFVVV